MKLVQATLFAPFAIAVLALAGCAPSPTGGGETSGTDSGSGSSHSSGSGGGDSFATVTVDGETWEYPSFMCAVGYEQTQSDTYSFSSTSFTTTEGKKVQFLVDVNDSSGQNRLHGDGVEYEIVLFDTANPEDPTVQLELTGTQGVTISGKSVTVSGEFIGFDGKSHRVDAEALCQ